MTIQVASPARLTKSIGIVAPAASAAIRRPARKRTCSDIRARAISARTSSYTSSRMALWGSPSEPPIPRSSRRFRPRTNMRWRERLWKNHYASTNANEYWAEGTQTWFWSNRRNLWRHPGQHYGHQLWLDNNRYYSAQAGVIQSSIHLLTCGLATHLNRTRFCCERTTIAMTSA